MAGVFISYARPAWVTSRVCLLELEHAVKQGKRLIPIV
jgi:hypothetical protein